MPIRAQSHSTAKTDVPRPNPNAASLRRHAPIIIHERHANNVTSNNWSGYAVTGPNGSVTDVKASWIVPAIQAACPSADQYSSFWVGIDGYSSNTVEQIGTDSDCQNGVPVYYAWYEFYPHWSYSIPLAIQPGDHISAEVSATAKGEFTVTIMDKQLPSGHNSFTTTTKMPSAARSSAEWIAEAPWSGGVLPLANFGAVAFGLDNTGISNTCYATISGFSEPLPLGMFPPTSIDSITMVDSLGHPKAAPLSLSSDGSFSIQWFEAGP
jgi:hypothetical protein